MNNLIAVFMNETAITIIALLLLSGAMAKSSQIPLHSWLPGSMEGPTPVSALIHAATLVTAGIYLLLRSSPLLEFSPTALLIITLVGTTTAFFAATCGLVQNDLKRIIAMSTISQLGSFLILISIIILILVFDTIIDFKFTLLQVISANSVPLKNSKIIASNEDFKDKFFEINSSINYLDKYNDFSYSGRRLIKQKYFKLQGIYLWINKFNNRSYVGKSVNLYLRINKYFWFNYINTTKSKMAICAAISKYNINNFTLYILEIIDKEKSKEYLSERENFWFDLI